MSLQVWLPLNGDLTQQGLLGNITASQVGATVNSAGKIGQCYFLSGASDANNIYFSHDKTIWNNKPITFACWIKPTTAYAGGCIMEIGADLCLSYIYNSSGIRFGYWRSYKNSSGARAGDSVFDTHYYPANQWYHIAVTFEKNINKLYVNGNLVNTWDQSSKYTDNFSPLLSGYSIFAIGKSYGSNTNYVDAYINDVRAYDHALSAKEIKEISKGLVLHYKLGKNRQILNNCYSLPTFNTSNLNGGWNHWGRSGASGSYGQNTDKKYIYRSENSYSHWVANAASATGEYLIYQSPAFDGGYRSLQCVIKEENSSPITENICFPAWNARNGGAENDTWTSINPLGEGFYLCKCEGISQNGSDDLVGIYVKPGYKVYFSECYLENNTEKCSDFLFVNNNIEEDCSGYGRDGTINGSISGTEDTPRYSQCIKLDTSSSYIKLPEITYSNFGNSYTFTWWQYCTNNASNMPWGFSNGNRLNCYHTGSKLYHNTGDGGSNPYQKNGTDVSSTNLLNSWHFMSLTGNGTTATLYIDGEVAGNAKAYKALTGTQIYISGWDTSENYKWTNGKLSDFRIYATALSAEDILELYHTSASIDNKGNLFCGEVVE